MERYASTGIKEIIAQFPRVAEILEEYGIGCGPCSIGVCRLKDILDIHSLDKNAELELMRRIEAEIYPQRNLVVAPRATTLAQAPDTSMLAAPLQTLIDEHRLIKRWLALIPKLLENLNLIAPEDRQIINQGIDFIRSYADQLHHGKEEEILFAFFDTSADIFQVIYADHRRARDLVKEMTTALAAGNGSKLTEHLLDYATLLIEHIGKEDGVLFPWLNNRLSELQVKDLTLRFAQVDQGLGNDGRRYQGFIEQLEERYPSNRIG